MTWNVPKRRGIARIQKKRDETIKSDYDYQKSGLEREPGDVVSKYDDTASSVSNGLAIVEHDD